MSTLSGAEICRAAERQQRWTDLMTNNRADWRWRDWWWFHHNKKLPRLSISGFDPTPSHRGGCCNPNSYNLKLDHRLKIYTMPAIPGEGRVIDSMTENPTETVQIDESGLILQPGVLYLGKTVEYTETFNLVPRIDGRSSIGRLGISTHQTAGYGDRAFCGAWTLEITAVQPVRIYPAMSICQISYSTVGDGWDYQGRYQNSTDCVPSRLHVGEANKLKLVEINVVCTEYLRGSDMRSLTEITGRDALNTTRLDGHDEVTFAVYRSIAAAIADQFRRLSFVATVDIVD